MMDFRFGKPLKNPKRIMAAVLTAAMIFQSLSVAAFADEAEVSDDVVVTEESFETAEELVTGEEEVIIEDSDASEAVEAEALESDDAVESDEESVEAKGEKEAIAATKITDLDGSEFIADDTQFFAEYDYAKEEGAGLKVTWKLKDKNAKLFSLYRLGNDGSFSKVDGTDTILLDKVSKKSYRDFYAFTDYDEFLNPQNTAGLYVLEAYSKEGAYLNSYITLPRTKMIRADLDKVAGAYGCKVNLTFCGIKGSQIKYAIESSVDKKSWTTIDDAYVPADDCCFTSAERPAVKYVDTHELALGEKRYYRVTAYAELKGGLVITTKTTKDVLIKQNYPAPDILACKNSEPSHPICYGNAALYVASSALSLTGVDNKTYFEICRSKGNGTITSQDKVLVRDCAVTTLDGQSVRIVPFTGVEPGVPYDYYVRIIRSDKIGALSAPYPVLGAYEDHIHPYYYIDASKPDDNEYPIEYVGKKQIKLRWVADDCAKNYYVYRVKNNARYETEEAAQAAVDRLNAGGLDNDVLKSMNFTKIGLVKNVAFDGNRVSFLDTKLEGNTGYYVYYIYPENLKERRGYDNGLALMIKAALPTPGDLEADTTVNSIKFRWEDLGKDVGAYRVQRTTALDGAGLPDFSKADYDEIVSNSRCYVLQKTTDAAPKQVKTGVRYYYRVMALNKKSGATTFSNWSDAKTAVVSNKPIHKVAVKPVFKSGMFMKQIKYQAMSNTDTADVAYYEIVKTTEDSDAAFDAAAAAQNPDSYYKFVTTKRNQKVTAFFPAVRGEDYFFVARPVSNTGIKGDWDKKKEVCLPTEFDLQAQQLINRPEEACDGHGELDTGVHKPFKVSVGESQRILIYFDPAATTYTDVTLSVKHSNVKAEYVPDKTVKIKGVKYHYFTITGASEKRCTTVTVCAKNYKDTGAKETTKLCKKFYVKVVK